jgi:hypothetical protein
LDNAVADAAPMAEKEPGRHYGVPSLMIVPTATPYLRKAARCGGYLAVVSSAIPPHAPSAHKCCTAKAARQAPRLATVTSRHRHPGRPASMIAEFDKPT